MHYILSYFTSSGAYLRRSHEEKIHAVAAVRRIVDVVPGKGEEGRHLPKDVSSVVHVHVLEYTDFPHCILPVRNPPEAYGGDSGEGGGRRE